MITISDIQKRLKKTFGTDEASVITDIIIPAIKKFIERYTNRVFEAGETASERTFYGTDTQDLEIDECVEITKVEGFDEDDVSQGVVSSDDYETHPFNQSYINRIHNKDKDFSEYKYVVTAKWGYSATMPDDITLAALEIACNLINQESGVKKESIEGYSYEISDTVEQNPIIKGVLDSYRKISI